MFTNRINLKKQKQNLEEWDHLLGKKIKTKMRSAL